MNRKPVFDAVRLMVGRGFTQAEVRALDRAIDEALADAPPGRRLGSLSERFESGGRGPGAVSSGRGDPGGVSYGIYQLSSRAGSVAAFLAGEGAVWQADLAGLQPGTGAFSAAWQAIAAREPEAFAMAQHAYIERTHYRPVVERVAAATGLDLDARHAAVRDASWSVAVQHAGAARILGDAIAQADALLDREEAGYDPALVEAIYARRSAYVLGVAARSAAPARRTLEGITRQRYPAELAEALAMFEEAPAQGEAPCAQAATG